MLSPGIAARSSSTLRSGAKMGMTTRSPAFAVTQSMNPPRRSMSAHFKLHTSPMRIPVQAAVTMSGWKKLSFRDALNTLVICSGVSGWRFTRRVAFSRLRLMMPLNGFGLPFVLNLEKAPDKRDIWFFTVSHAYSAQISSNHAFAISGVTSLIVSHRVVFLFGCAVFHSVQNLCANVLKRANVASYSFSLCSVGV